MRRRDLIAGLLLVPFATPAMAAVKQISILHSGFPNRTPIHVLIDAFAGARLRRWNGGDRAAWRGRRRPASRHTGNWISFQKTGRDYSANLASRSRVETGWCSDACSLRLR